MLWAAWESYQNSWQSSMTLDANLPQELMANHVKFTGKVGDVLLFDTACWHTYAHTQAAIVFGFWGCI